MENGKRTWFIYHLKNCCFFLGKSSLRFFLMIFYLITFNVIYLSFNMLQYCHEKLLPDAESLGTAILQSHQDVSG